MLFVFLKSFANGRSRFGSSAGTFIAMAMGLELGLVLFTFSEPRTFARACCVARDYASCPCGAEQLVDAIDLAFPLISFLGLSCCKS